MIFLRLTFLLDKHDFHPLFTIVYRPSQLYLLQLQNEQCDESVYAGEVNQTNKTASSLLEHLHEILSHRYTSQYMSFIIR